MSETSLACDRIERDYCIKFNCNCLVMHAFLLSKIWRCRWPTNCELKKLTWQMHNKEKQTIHPFVLLPMPSSKQTFLSKRKQNHDG